MRITVLAIVVMGLCVMAVPEAGPAAPAAPIDQVPANTLTPAEKAAGWRLLFDGTTTSGWRGYRKADMPAGWAAENGTLTRAAPAGDIVTADQFENFELAFDWMIKEKGNSGVFIRATEDEKEVWQSAPEYQILDNKGHADGMKPETSAGSDYALHAPARDVTRPVGQWNQARIVAKGAHVEHWLNGVKLLEYELWSAEWKALVAKSKFAKYPAFGMAKRGRIGIQDHGDWVSYRNIKIRIL